MKFSNFSKTSLHISDKILKFMTAISLHNPEKSAQKTFPAQSGF